jgi:hypothetical protein
VIEWLFISLGVLIFAGWMLIIRWWEQKYYRPNYLAASGGLMLNSIQYSETGQMIADTVLIPFAFFHE